MILSSIKTPQETIEVSREKLSNFGFLLELNNKSNLSERIISSKETTEDDPDIINSFFKENIIAQFSENQKVKQNNSIIGYLSKSIKQPEALRNSFDLYLEPKLEDINQRNYRENPKEFIINLMDNKELIDQNKINILLNMNNSKFVKII